VSLDVGPEDLMGTASKASWFSPIVSATCCAVWRMLLAFKRLTAGEAVTKQQLWPHLYR
jgi:hypothetical protein